MFVKTQDMALDFKNQDLVQKTPSDLPTDGNDGEDHFHSFPEIYRDDEED